MARVVSTHPADIVAAFRKYDRNQSGKLDYRELRNALQGMGLDTSMQDAVNVLRKYDADRSGLLEIDEFANLVHQFRAWMAASFVRERQETERLRAELAALQQANQRLSRAEVMLAKSVRSNVLEAFMDCDRDGSGDVDVRELKPALRALGLQGDTSQALNVLQKYDKDGNGMLSVFEFLKCVDELLEFQNMLGGGGAGQAQPAVARLAEPARPAKAGNRGGW